MHAKVQDLLMTTELIMNLLSNYKDNEKDVNTEGNMQIFEHR